MTLSVNNLNLNSYTYQNGAASSLVSNAEMLKIANEILASAPKIQSVGTDNTMSQINSSSIINDNAVKVFGIDSANAQTIRQIAINRANLDVSLNQETLSAIESLKSRAMNATNISSKLDGKIFIPTETPNTDRPKSIFSTDNTINLSSTGDLDKDKRGSNPFILISVKKEGKREKQDNLNIFA